MFTVQVEKFRDDGTITEFYYCDEFEARTNLGGQKHLYILRSYSNKKEGHRKEFVIGDRNDCDNVVHLINIYNIKGELVDRARWNINY